MKKWKLLLIIPLLPLFSGCDKSNVELQILSFNDYHGAVVERDEQMGLLNFASTIKNKTKEYKNTTVILSAGDMYQGSAESNIGNGKIMVDVMNEIGLDAMAIGNHEFDWGIETIEAHHDSDTSNVEANYPYLGCNIYEKDSNTRVDWADDYKIVTREGINIGIVGWIASSCVDDIATSIISPYTFVSPAERVLEIAKTLRNEKNCDIVIAVGHEENDLLNEILRANEEAKIDLIINGHTHQAYVYGENNCNIIQSGTTGEYLGVTKIKYDKKNKEVISVQSENELVTSVTKKDSNVSKIIDDNLKEISPIVNRVISKAGESVDRMLAAKWAARTLKAATEADFGIVNFGGIRSNAFPINKNDDIKVSKVWEIMPFDNYVKTCLLTGRQIKSLEYDDDSFVWSTNPDFASLDEETLYKVAACDYIFDKPKYCFTKGQEVTLTPLLVRDAMIKDLEAWQASGLDFMPSQGTKVGNLLTK